MAQAPSAPTDFVALVENGSVPCPSPDPSQSDASCKQTNLSWTYTSAPDTSFRIYAVSIGEDPTATCEASSAQASPVLDTKPAITSAHLFNEVSVGGGAQCLWITAVNAAGESPRVAPKASTEAKPRPQQISAKATALRKRLRASRSGRCQKAIARRVAAQYPEASASESTGDRHRLPQAPLRARSIRQQR